MRETKDAMREGIASMSLSMASINHSKPRKESNPSERTLAAASITTPRKSMARTARAVLVPFQGLSDEAGRVSHRQSRGTVTRAAREPVSHNVVLLSRLSRCSSGIRIAPSKPSVLGS
jgi:hypothetical protein